MEKCRAKDRLYNIKTKRCYKSCEQKNKVTHPVTKKCRQKCKPNKTRRMEDFRCVVNAMTRIKHVKLPTPSTPIRADEPLLPPPLQKEIVKNYKFIEDLVKKGEGKRVEYDPSLRVSEIITIYFHEKYSKHCPMYPIKTYSVFDTDDFKKDYKKNKKTYTFEELKAYRLNQDKAYYIDWNKDKFLKNLKLCLETGEELIMVPLRIPGHLNMLIIKEGTREIIRFEPHGAVYSNNELENTKTNIFLQKLTDDINVYLNLKGLNKFIYINPLEICPKYHPRLPHFYDGFQTMEVKVMKNKPREGAGFCQLWSWFFAECIINNPELPVKEVYKEAYDTVRQDEMNFASVIRGYFYSINEELLKMKKDFSIKGKYIKNINNNEFLLEYLKQGEERLKGKPRNPFVGGGQAPQTPH
jgi:hypothetical protein